MGKQDIHQMYASYWLLVCGIQGRSEVFSHDGRYKKTRKDSVCETPFCRGKISVVYFFFGAAGSTAGTLVIERCRNRTGESSEGGRESGMWAFGLWFLFTRTKYLLRTWPYQQQMMGNTSYQHILEKNEIYLFIYFLNKEQFSLTWELELGWELNG